MGSATGLVVYLYVVSCGAGYLMCEDLSTQHAVWQDKVACEQAASVVSARLSRDVFHGGRKVMTRCHYGITGGNRFRPESWAKTKRQMENRQEQSVAVLKKIR